MSVGILIDAVAAEKVISNQILDESGVLISPLQDYLLQEDATTVQIFFADGIPADPIVGQNTGEQFVGYNARVFEAYNERVFKS